MQGAVHVVSNVVRGAVSRPRRVALLGVLVAALAGLAALQLTPTSPQGLLARGSSDVGRATNGQEKAFGGEPIVVVLDANVQNTVLAPDNLTKLVSIEAKLAKVRGVQTAIGPGSFVNQSVNQMSKVVSADLGPIADTADKVAKAAEAKAKADPRFTDAEAAEVGDQARLKALKPVQGEYEALFARLGSIGLPSLTNTSFVSQLVLGASPTPKKRFAWLFPDQKHALILIRPRHGISDATTSAIGRSAQKIVAAGGLKGIKTSVAGPPLVIARATTTVADELLRLLPVVVAAMALALLFAFGRRRRALHLLLPAGAAVLLTLGLSWPLGLGFTAATLAAVPVVLGLALDYAVQLQARYWNAREEGYAPRPAAIVAAERVGPTLALAAAAMALGFLTLLFSPVPLVGRLGLILALGVGCSLVSVFTLAGPLMVRFDRPGVQAPLAFVPTLRPGRRTGRVGVVLVLLVTVGGLALSRQTHVQSDLRKLANADMPELKSLESLQRELGTGGTIRIAVTAPDVTTPDVLAWMNGVDGKVTKLDKRLEPGPNLSQLLQVGGEAPLSQASVESLLKLVPAQFTAAILSPDHRRAELSFGIPLGSAQSEAALINRIQQQLEGAPAGVDAQVAGLQALTASSVHGLQDERPWLLLLAAFVVFALLWFVRRDVERALIPIAPALFAAGATAAIVELAGGTLSPLSAGLDPLVLAVGVEFGLLLEARYREERIAGRSIDAAARRSAELLGVPVAVAAGTVALGFAVLGVSRLPVLQQFGLVAAMELVLSVVSAVMMVPLLAAASERRHLRAAAAAARPRRTPSPVRIPTEETVA